MDTETKWIQVSPQPNQQIDGHLVRLDAIKQVRSIGQRVQVKLTEDVTTAGWLTAHDSTETIAAFTELANALGLKDQV